ncbi:DoxX family protein [Maribacter ulvicola]|uniref:DoxX-like family protein n=1 Tax=Maribacter ulvicola TaxID=228959 RepID=A0A1N6X8K3_9FLAO|nr:DoxX family protein [Maribacter ulvicola]SIQ98685.1 DoxX-like family protein [Maribacter ulvicola]
MTRNKITRIVVWVLRITAAIILLQTLFFKFTAHPDSVYIFSTLNIEPWGRVGTGILELVAAILLLWPRYAFWGAITGVGVMVGAIFSHLFILGINVNNDGGVLFTLALAVFLSCIILVLLERKVLPEYIPYLERFKFFKA